MIKDQNSFTKTGGDQPINNGFVARPHFTVWKGEPALGGWYTEAEIDAAVAAIRDSMDWNTGFYAAREIEAFESAFAEYIGTDYAVALNGAGTGLDVALMCLDLEPGDEIISCAINFPGTHLAIIGQGARLVLCEPDPITLNIDPSDVIRRISSRTRAILVTHMNGLSANMDSLLAIAEQYPHPKYGPLKIIGDAARACGAKDHNSMVGKKGWMTVFSFQSKKLMTTLGEGGMIVTDDPIAAARTRRIRSFGAGEDWGTNYKMTKVQAAVGMVQLKRLPEMNARRITLAEARTAILSKEQNLQLPIAPSGYQHVYYLYTITLPQDWAFERRDHLMLRLEKMYGIGCRVANPPTYTSNKLIQRHTEGQETSLADDIGGRIFSIVLHPLMTDDDNIYVTSSLLETMASLS